MHSTVVVLTCPRSKAYLWDTLASLNRAGACEAFAPQHRWVLSDGDAIDGQRVLDADWQLHRLGGDPRGNLRAFLAVFAFALRDVTCDHLLFFEDDVVACKGAIARMLQTGVPHDCAFTSFFDMKECPYGMPPQLHKVSTMGADGRGYWGSQAILWPRRTMEYLVARGPAMLEGGSAHSSDCLFGSHLLFSATPHYALHVPSLVEHVGDVSAIWTWMPKVNRKATSFLGEDFDASLLPVWG